jgi:hypothetical protein
LPSPWEQLTAKDARDLIATRAYTPDDEEARDFHAGQMWRNGDGWLGQRPPADSESYAAQMLAIETAFVGKNVVREITLRHVAGVLGREPAWSFVPRRPLAEGESPTAQEQALADEAAAALTEWWDRHRPLRTLQAALATALLVERAPLRLLVPQGLRDESGRLAVPPGDGALAAALGALYLDAPEPAAAGVFADDATRREAGVFAFTDYPDAKPGLPPSGQGVEKAEVSFALDGDEGTALRIIGPEGIEDEAVPPLALGGRLTLHELRRDRLVTRQVRQLQKALNLDLTQMMRNVNLAGSLERTFLNVMPPGAWQDASGKVISAREAATTPGAKFVPESLPVGAGVSAFLRGQEVRDKDGNLTGYANGSVNYREPVSVTTFTDTAAELYRAILAEVGQLHALIASDATASGESRKQARAEFAATLDVSKTAVDEAGRWLLETALALAATLANQAGRYAELRCEFNARLDPGPIAADERTQYVAEWEKGAISHETLLSWLEIDDPDAEMARIEAERGAQDGAFLALAGGGAQRGQVAQAGGQQQAPGDVLAGELGGATNGQGGGVA